MANERDCKTCAHKHPDGSCDSWKCEYISRDEAIKAYRKLKELTEVLDKMVDK